MTDLTPEVPGADQYRNKRKNNEQFKSSKKVRVTAATVVTGKPLRKTAAAVTLEITDHQDTPLDQLQVYSLGQLNVVVGEPVRLRVRVRNRHGAQLAGIRWTVPGNALGQCVQTGALGTAVLLADADCSAGDVSFFWITGGTHNVQVTATVDGQVAMGAATVRVHAPRVDFFRITTSAISVVPAGQYLTEPGSWLALFEPGHNRRYGCTWDARVAAPIKLLHGGQLVLGGGDVAVIQVIGFSVTVSPQWPEGDDIPAPRVMRTQSGDTAATALDTDRQDDVIYSREVPVAAGAQVQLGPNDPYFCDSPGYKLEDHLVSIDGKDLYQTHLVYKSDTPGSIWVSLARAEWRWKASITRDDIYDATSAWGAVEQHSVTPTPHQATAAQVGPGQPTWTQRGDAIRGPRPIQW